MIQQVCADKERGRTRRHGPPRNRDMDVFYPSSLPAECLGVAVGDLGDSVMSFFIDGQFNG